MAHPGPGPDQPPARTRLAMSRWQAAQSRWPSASAGPGLKPAADEVAVTERRLQLSEKDG